MSEYKNWQELLVSLSLFLVVNADICASISAISLFEILNQYNKVNLKYATCKILRLSKFMIEVYCFLMEKNV
jgi:hypothetical protein